ncbi:unnamed protein product [Pieris macdunnoughi]|uniref:Uncharacterized protein n=1 Tax=Pieris macdunnoughi TaxID=345717 RepID=A0A821L7T4_9NEOP|nr:unnamed protein product [Pieris macdunnoughi]
MDKIQGYRWKKEEVVVAEQPTFKTAPEGEAQVRWIAHEGSKKEAPIECVSDSLCGKGRAREVGCFSGIASSCTYPCSQRTAGNAQKAWETVSLNIRQQLKIQYIAKQGLFRRGRGESGWKESGSSLNLERKLPCQVQFKKIML